MPRILVAVAARPEARAPLRAAPGAGLRVLLGHAGALPVRDKQPGHSPGLSGSEPQAPPCFFIPAVLARLLGAVPEINVPADCPLIPADRGGGIDLARGRDPVDGRQDAQQRWRDTLLLAHALGLGAGWARVTCQ